MAKHTGKKAIWLPFSEDLAIGALAANDVVAGSLGGTFGQDVFVLAVKATWSIADLTVDEGSLVVGVADIDYSAPEIEEALEASGSWDLSDRVAVEQARRLVRTAGTFDGDQTHDKLNDGNAIYTTCKWLTNQSKGLNAWAWNVGDETLTTGAIVHVDGHVLVFRR